MNHKLEISYWGFTDKLSCAEELRDLLSFKKTLLQKINFLLAYIQFKLRNNYLYSYPAKLFIDPVNHCNLNCQMCAVGLKEEGRKQSFMTFSTFQKIIDEAHKYIWEIFLYNWGEPLLNKYIFQMIQYATTKHIFVNMSSNLNYFNDEISINLVKSGLNRLIVSLAGASQASVEKYQKGNNFEAVIENIKRMVFIKHKLNSKVPFIQWRYAVNKHNEHEIVKAKELARSMEIDKLEIIPFECYQEIFLDNESEFKKIKPWLPQDEGLSKYNYSKRCKKQRRPVCRLLWWWITIQPDGSVSPCCSIWPGRFDFGNINDMPLKQIWNSEKYIAARRINQGKRISSSNNICHICKMNSGV